MDIRIAKDARISSHSILNIRNRSVGIAEVSLSQKIQDFQTV